MAPLSVNFSSIPILNYTLSLTAQTKPQFILELRNALINVGFLYLSNTSVDQAVIDRLIDYVPRFFALPDAEKQRIKMSNSPHFLGYSRLGTELTKGNVDQREQVDIATPHVCRWNEGDPVYRRLWGESQWPDESLIPGFKAAMEAYLEQVSDLAANFIKLFSEALGLSPDGLDKFYDTPDKMQHRSKLVRYPPVSDSSTSDQGVGPHYDAGFLTILLQASNHPGLQVQNLSGDWIDAPPIPGTFVLNIGKALEFATHGIARATSHRVISPSKSSTTPRYSIPFFHNIGLDVQLTSPEYSLSFPDEIVKMRDERAAATTDSVNFTEFGEETSGQVNLIGRVKSHPDAAQVHYPALFRKYFPDGLPTLGSAY